MRDVLPELMEWWEAGETVGVGTVVEWLAKSRSEGKAINLRLRLLRQGRTTGEALSLLKRADSALPSGLPSPILRLGHRFDRHPARRLTGARSALVEGRSDALPLDQAVFAARDREAAAPHRLDLAVAHAGQIGAYDIGGGLQHPLLDR